MKKLILTFIFFIGSICTNAQQLLEVLKPHITNTFTPSEKCLELVYDRNYGDGKHNFIYCAIMGEDGRKWLNLNLGAEYAREPTADNPNPYFDPTQQATSPSDWKAYGSLFQWQRPADGHELTKWTSSNTGFAINGYIRGIWDNINWAPNHNKSLIGDSGDNSSSWVTASVNSDTNYHNLWQTGGANNPCPQNYHPPTNDEWEYYTYLVNPHKHSYLHEYWETYHTLKLTNAGMQAIPYYMHGAGSYMLYWSSSSNKTDKLDSFIMSEMAGDHFQRTQARGHKLPIRCVQDGYFEED